MREFVLENNIKVCVKQNKNTPRIALTLNFLVPEPEKYAGEYSLICRLLLKGTKKYSSEELAAILDENAIELYADMKSDYLRFRLICLNEDFELALSILNDIIQNSVFEEFVKEREKMKGELVAELDSAKVRLSDLFTETIYKNHFYGHGYTKTLAEIDKVSHEDIINSYKNILNNSKKTAALAGDTDGKILNKYLGKIPPSSEMVSDAEKPAIPAQEYTEIIKSDANQAQILQGWMVPAIGEEDYPALMLLNIILGASGLSSRLFRELREKKGLAYTVRTSYDIHLKSAVFSIYIGTEPSNIKTSIDGFKEEIKKIKDTLIDEEELENAKNNWMGKQQFISETNSQQANTAAYYAIMGKPFDYKSEIIQKIKSVTAEQIQSCVRKYFTENYVLAVIKPQA